MLDSVILLLLLSVPPIFSHQQENNETKCPVFSGQSIFVNTTGEDSETCGPQTKPCRSIAYAVELAGRKNINSVILNISVGNYQEAESLKLDCGRRRLQRVTFWGARYGYLTIRPVALEGEGSNCFSITQLVGQKRYY